MIPNGFCGKFQEMEKDFEFLENGDLTSFETALKSRTFLGLSYETVCETVFFLTRSQIKDLNDSNIWT